MMMIDRINKEDDVGIAIDITFPTLLTFTGIFFYFMTNWTIKNIKHFVFTLDIWWNNSWLMDDIDDVIDYSDEDSNNLNEIINWNEFNLVVLNNLNSFDLGNI